MKNIFKAGVLLTAFSAFAAHADLYDFSYSFNDSSTISGYLSGNTNGDYVENISNVHVFLNGTEFSGASLFGAAWNTTTQDWDNTQGPVVSSKAELNNFIFADANVPSDYNVSNYFYFVNDASSLGQEVFANNLNTGELALDNPSNGSWSLVDVPEPTAYTMLMAGLGLIAVTRLRRRQQH